MPKIKSGTGKTITVSSKVRVGKPGSARQKSYCARSAKIRGNWKTNKDSKNYSQRRRWKCPKVRGEK
jgi:hypothetical protein